MLEILNLTVRYGGLRALDRVSMQVSRDQFVAIVGPNGAGKTSLFRAISGTVEPTSGHIRYRGQDLCSMDAAARARNGIAHVPEGRKVFTSMSVLENIEMGAYRVEGRKHFRTTLARIYELFPALKEHSHRLAGTLSGGQQQMVAIARGLASRPQLLMLDEPSMGLAPTVVDAIFETLKALHEEDKLTILLVEQRAPEALELCNHGYVLNTGQVAFEGSRDDLMGSSHVSEAYLGL